MDRIDEKKNDDDDDDDDGDISKDPNPNWTRAIGGRGGGLYQPSISPKIRMYHNNKSTSISRLKPVIEAQSKPPKSNHNNNNDNNNKEQDAIAMPPPPARAVIAPEHWNDDGYFDEKIRVVRNEKNQEEEEFCVYRADINDSDREEEGITSIICLHGCPYAALSWAPFVKQFRNSSTNTNTKIYAIDLRNHGESLQMRDKNDFSLERMTDDIIFILKEILDDSKAKKNKCVLLGHSMGASVATSVALREDIWKSNERIKLAGLIVIDVVEGSALKALPMMSLQLLNRPTSFRTMRDAFRWCVGFGGSTKNLESARISFPAQLKSNDEDDRSSTLVFRCDVVKTEPYWKEWYLGMSERFLKAKTSKALLLAGTDRLDTTLTIAQMQGKFQMVVFPQSGHAIQEDEPEKFTQVIIDFLARYVCDSNLE